MGTVRPPQVAVALTQWALYARCSNGTNQQDGKKSIRLWSVFECVSVHKDMCFVFVDGLRIGGCIVILCF